MNKDEQIGQEQEEVAGAVSEDDMAEVDAQEQEAEEYLPPISGLSLWGNSRPVFGLGFMQQSEEEDVEVVEGSDGEAEEEEESFSPVRYLPGFFG